MPSQDQRKAKPKEQLLKVFPLMALIFYEVSGGPFGCEDAVGASTPAIAILGFLVFPLVWSVPEALITAEMSVMFPEDSGYVAWVTYAFNPYLGFMEGVLSWVSGMTDNALYPVLAVDYFSFLLPDVGHEGVRYAVIFTVTLLLTWLNYRGLVVVGRTAVFLTVFSMLPFVAMIALALPEVNPENWQASTLLTDLTKVQWPKYINIIFWNVNYWDSVSTLAGEVHNPEETIPKAFFLAVVLMVLAYTLPLAVGTGICVPVPGGGCAPASAWRDGCITVPCFSISYFSKVARVIGGRPLQYFLLLSAGLSNVGLFEAEMCSDSYQIYGMAERGLLPAVCATRSKHGTPTVGILMSAAGVLFVSLNGFTDIVEMLNVLYCYAALLEFAAFLKIRRREPFKGQGFRIPLGFWGCCAMLVPGCLMILFVIFIASWATFVVTGIVSVGGTALYFFLKLAKEYQWMEFLPDDQASRELMLLLPHHGDSSYNLSEGEPEEHTSRGRSLILSGTTSPFESFADRSNSLVQFKGGLAHSGLRGRSGHLEDGKTASFCWQ